MKKCRLCDLEKELTEFGYDKYELDGRNTRCKYCINTLKKNKNFVAISDGKKKCMHCKEEKEVASFHKNRTNSDGLHVWCRACTKKKTREYRAKNPTGYERRRQKNFINWRTKLGIDPSIKIRNRNGEGYINQQGYLSFKKKDHPCSDKNGRVQASHLYYYEHTGYILKKGESLHHKNGLRLDNRIENLELWSKSQPAGQRVEDKIEWAKKLLEEYGYRITKE